MNKLYGLFAATLLCSCSQDWSRGIDGHQVAVVERAAGPAISPMTAAKRASNFADAPDLGTLVQYPTRLAGRRMGAYTWHPVRLSEDHALNAIVEGEMTVTAPDGRPIRLSYERHIEHPDGNWTWIGRSRVDSDQTAVITFGETAVFGSIPQARNEAPLRLTMTAGRSWIVSTDNAVLGKVHNEATNPVEPDYFVPPKIAAASTSSGDTAAASAPATALAATASAITVVDVLVGYTNGYATYLGGQAAAQTRIHNLVDITNQAYLSSQVDAQIRLVKTLQVNYPDATENGIALEEMTGFRAPSTRTTPAPAFAALRAARDQYGADVVSLVRKFSSPENDGCGIAWLIGGGMSGIAQSDEFFGYSVVSDGQDRGTDGSTYFCREETFAHELGHNIGSQHDKVAADNTSGAYAYSYGYKTDAGAGNFYTIMAYGDDGQSRYRVFSNPRIAVCGGRACGVTNQADNARSLGQAIPIIATFRTSILSARGSRARHDVDGDGKSDLLLRYYKTAPNNFSYWIMNGAGRVRTGADSMGASYRIAATGDFNGDGRLDMVWAADSVRNAVMWLGTGTSWVKRSLGTYGLGWTVAGAGDIDGDGKSDLLFRYYKTAPNNFSYWIMDGASRVRTGAASMGASYRMAATGDFNGDAKLDIVWTADNGRAIAMWIGNGTSFSFKSLGTYGLGWSVTAAGDIDGDGKSDLLLRYYKTAPNNYNYWIMNGPSRVRQGFATVGASYRIAATGDYNGDGELDIVWSADSIRRLYMSTGAGASFRLLASYGLGWSLAGT